MKHVFSALYHFLWYALAAVLISAAIVVTAARLALPGIGEYKNEIEAWVSEYMDYPLQIDSISADWKGWSPQLHLTQIDLYNIDNTEVVAKFDHASLGIDLIGSLIKGEVIPQRLAVTGLDLQLTRKTDGSIAITNMQKANLNDNSNAALADWLFKQNKITLQDSNISWKDNKRGTPVRKFEHVKIDIKTDADRFQLNASVELPKEYGKALSLKMDIMGNILTPNWSGDIYANGQDIKLDEFTENLAISIERGNANVELWTHWQNSRLQDFSARFNHDNILLRMGQDQLAVNVLQANVSGVRQQQKDWYINVQLDKVETENGLWPVSDYQLTIAHNSSGKPNRYQGFASYLNLSETLPCLLAIAKTQGLAPDFSDNLINASGYLKNTSFAFGLSGDDEENLFIDTEFVDLSLADMDKQNAVARIDGRIRVNKNVIKIMIDDIDSSLRSHVLYDEPLSFNKINAELDIALDETPLISIQELHMVNDDASVDLLGEIKFDQKSPFIDLIARVGQSNLESIPAYLPKQTNPKLVKWMNQALVAGDIISGDVLFRGRLSEYPFENDNGVFKTILNVENATLEYKTGWPHVNELTAQVVIDNDDLTVSSYSGSLFDASIKQFTAKIDDMTKGNHQLSVNGSVYGHTNDARLFIEQSPLQKNASLNEFSKMNIIGNLDLDLELDIALKTKKTKVNGTIGFIDTTIESNLPGLGLEKVNGQMQFTRHNAWATSMDALYHGKKVKLDIPKKEKGSRTSVFTITGNANKSFIISELGMFFPTLLEKQQDLFGYFDGESEWSVTIKRRTDNNKNIHKDIEIRSNLDGIDIQLPYPLNKTREQIRPIVVETRQLNNIIENINIEYDDDITTSIQIDNSQDLAIKQVFISVGQDKQEAVSQQSDILVSGNIDKLKINEWIEFFNLRKMAREKAGLKDKKRSILVDLQVDDLVMLDQSFEDTRLTLTNPTSGWKAEVDGADIKGQAQLTKRTDQEKQVLSIELERLTFNDKVDENSKAKKKPLDLNKLPEIDASINQLTFHDKQLGETRLITNNVENAINITTLNFITPEVEINATGKWSVDEGINRSDFDASIKANSLSGLLSTFNYDGTNIDGGKTQINLSANWMDTPLSFSKEKASGELDMQIGKGQLPDVNPSAGRFFGLLSVATLPRRLKLDFSDLFKKGFAFDRIEGNFTIDRGDAYTNNLSMTAPAANIVVSGRTGLIEQDYDQVATVLPKVSGTLPVASALFGPIGIGVGAMIYLAGELFDNASNPIDKILSYQYSIKGSWQNPDIVKLDDDNKSG